MDGSSPTPSILPLFPTAAVAPITRATQACNGCRKSKARCINFQDGACQLCREKGRECVMAPDLAKDRAAQSRARNEENERLRQQMGPEVVRAILHGSGVEAETALLALGRLEGRVGGSGPAGCLEDIKRVCHNTEHDSEFVPNSSDAGLLAYLSTDASVAQHDEHGLDSDGLWVWSSGTVPPIESFDEDDYGGQWLPSKEECETHIDFFFDRLQPLMPMLSETRFRAAFAELWEADGQRGRKSYFPWAQQDLNEAEQAKVADFLPVLFAAMACASSSSAGEEGDGARYHCLAIWNMHFLDNFSSQTVDEPRLHHLQVIALLSSHLASLGHLGGAWRLLKYGAALVNSHNLHLSAAYGLGVDAEFLRRTFWVFFNIDKTLARIVGEPFQLNTPHVGGCALPVDIDEGTSAWTRYFSGGLPSLTLADASPTQATIFITLCKLSHLSSRIVADLYPALRDRSQDWRLAGARGLLEMAVEGWEEELAELEEDVWRICGARKGRQRKGVARSGVEEVLRNMTLDVRLLIHRVELPRSSSHIGLIKNVVSLDPQLAVVEEVFDVTTTTRLSVPRSIYSVQETVTVYLAAVPILFANLVEIEGSTSKSKLLDRNLNTCAGILGELAVAWPESEVFSESIADLAQLVRSFKAQSSSSGSGRGRKKSKKPAHLKKLDKGKSVAKVEPLSAGIPFISPPGFVRLSLESPMPDRRVASPRPSGRYQPYPTLLAGQSPPAPSAQLNRVLHKYGVRPRSVTMRGSSSQPPYLSSSMPQTGVHTSQRYTFLRSPEMQLGNEPRPLEQQAVLSDNSISPSSREPHTPNALDSTDDWSSPEAYADGRPSLVDVAPSQGRYLAPTVMHESPSEPPQPLGYGAYEMDDEVPTTGGEGTLSHSATYSMPDVRSRPSGLLTAPSTNPNKFSPETQMSFPATGYDASLAAPMYGRARPAGLTPWDLSFTEGTYRPVSSTSAVSGTILRPSPAGTYSTYDTQGAFDAPYDSAEVYAPFSSNYTAAMQSSSAPPVGHHPLPSPLNYQSFSSSHGGR